MFMLVYTDVMNLRFYQVYGSVFWSRHNEMAGRSRTASGVGKSRDQNNLGFLVLSIQIRSGTGALSFRESYDAIPDFMQAIKSGRSGRMGFF